MSVAVIGAGMTGLTAAYRLVLAGEEVRVYERWPGIGGQVATFDLDDGHLVERYYHALMTTDTEIVSLYEELGMAQDVEWRPSRVAILSEGAIHPFTSPFDLLRFRPMSRRARVRMGLRFLRLSRKPGRVADYEEESARDWVSREMGTEAWEQVWGPLLRGKFGDRGEEISMAWLWKKLILRRPVRGSEIGREMLGYPRGSWQPLLDRLRAEIEARGGRIEIDRPVARLRRGEEGGFDVTLGAPGSFRHGHDPREYPTTEHERHHDEVIATVPSDIFLRLLDERLADELPHDYLSKLRSTEYHTALCLVMALDRPLTEYFWTNIADPDLPFVGIIEKTNLIDPRALGGRHLVYVANYVPSSDRLLDLELDELIGHYESGLRKVNPGFTREWIQDAWLFREPAAQPVVTVGYQRTIPPMRSPIPGLWLANTTQIYPEDRGTNYSVSLGAAVASEVLASKVSR